MSFSPGKFAEKYQLALEAARAANPRGGTAGFELEWNMYDSDFKPVLTVGTGPDQQGYDIGGQAGVVGAVQQPDPYPAARCRRQRVRDGAGDQLGRRRFRRDERGLAVGVLALGDRQDLGRHAP